jgi:hypothetical protein
MVIVGNVLGIALEFSFSRYTGSSSPGVRLRFCMLIEYRTVFALVSGSWIIGRRTVVKASLSLTAFVCQYQAQERWWAEEMAAANRSQPKRSDLTCE